jgi:hypothetical protein
MINEEALKREKMLETDRIRQRKRYAEKKEEIRKVALENYYKRKEVDPNFHPRPVGRPRKEVTLTK